MKRIVISNVALVLVLIFGIAYVLFEVVRINPTKTLHTVNVNLERTGGLLERADVTYLGVPIGRVDSIDLRDDGVRARITLDSDYQVPADSEVVVAGLSAAGEQHLDFRPRRTGGPYLGDGSVIDQKDTSTPKPFAELLAHVGAISDQLDPKQLGVIVDELVAATDGSAPDLRRMLTGGRLLLTGLEDVLPETTRLLENGHTTLTTISDLSDELERFGKAGKTVGATLKGSDADIRKLLDSSPQALALLADVITEIGPTLGALTGDMNRVTKLIAERLPAWGTYLPELTRFGNTLPLAINNGGVTALADLYPRDMCDYDTPRRAPTIGGSPDPRTDAYCTTYGPELQQRGAYYAPRPAGDDTAGPGARSSDGPEASTRDSTPRSASADRTAQQPSADRATQRLSGPMKWYETYFQLVMGDR